MPREPVVPAGAPATGFVLRRHAGELRRVELLEHPPDVVERPQKQHVRVDVQQRVRAVQHFLNEETGVSALHDDFNLFTIDALQT